MSHLLPFALCVAGFAALAFAVRRQQRDIIGRPLPMRVTYALRVAGAGAMLLALGFLVAAKGWGIGLVIFSGQTSIAAGFVLCALIGQTRVAR
jgi:hypothetical protein